MFKLNKNIYPLPLILTANEAFENLFEVNEDGRYYVLTFLKDVNRPEAFLEFANYVASLM